jgi:hypothetical protein
MVRRDVEQGPRSSVRQMNQPRKPPPFQFGLKALFLVMSLVAATLWLPGVVILWVALAATRAWAAESDWASEP